MRKKAAALFFLTAFLAFFGSTVIFAFCLEDLVSPENAAALAAGNKPVLAQFKNPRPEFVPRHQILKGLVEAVYRDLDPSVIVETLYIYKKPPDAEKNAISDAELAELFNGTLAMSTLAGIQYFSATRGSMRTFYETSSVIDGPSTKKSLPDPVYTRPPAELTIYARQKDMTFGDNIYQYDFYTAAGTMIFIQQNLTSLTYGIIPAVGKNKLRSVVAVLDAGDQLLVYAASMAKAASLMGMNNRIGNSFANRADAILAWFSEQADKAFRKAHS
jgi:hypothetical protein